MSSIQKHTGEGEWVSVTHKKKPTRKQRKQNYRRRHVAHIEEAAPAPAPAAPKMNLSQFPALGGEGTAVTVPVWPAPQPVSTASLWDMPRVAYWGDEE